jgi:hypothetical protein
MVRLLKCVLLWFDDRRRPAPLWASHEVHPNEDFPPTAILTGELPTHKTLCSLLITAPISVGLGKKGDGVADRKHRSTSLMEAWITAMYPQQGN